MMSRYLSLLLLLVVVAAVCVTVEMILRMAGAPISLTDTKGAGQVLLFIVIIPILLGFAILRGGGPRVFLAPYFANLPRALAGFGAMWLKATILMLITYGLLGLMGYVTWSSEAWAAFNLTLLWKTIVAILVVVVLAYTEEHIFRGFVFRHLRYDATALVTWAALITAAALFSSMHLISYKEAWTFNELGGLLFGLFLLGGLFIVTYISTNSLACSIGMHTGLLGFKVFLRRTKLLDYSPDAWWLGNSGDIRLAPATWALMIIIGLITWSLRHRLRARFGIEPVTSPRTPQNP